MSGIFSSKHSNVWNNTCDFLLQQLSCLLKVEPNRYRVHITKREASIKQSIIANKNSVCCMCFYWHILYFVLVKVPLLLFPDLHLALFNCCDEILPMRVELAIGEHCHWWRLWEWIPLAIRINRRGLNTKSIITLRTSDWLRCCCAV